MAVSEDKFTWQCYRNGGETYGEPENPGVAYRFPDAETSDRVYYFLDNNTFDVITTGRFYSARSLQQYTDSWIDDNDRLYINTEDARVIIDPR